MNATERVTRLTELSLCEVAGTDKKFRAATEAGIDTVLIAKMEPKSDEENVIDTRREKQASTQGRRDPAAKAKDVHIERVSTIGQALDWLLQNNRFIHAYKAQRVQAWESKWIDGTGSLPALLESANKAKPTPAKEAGKEPDELDDSERSAR
jgi:hypothetical protein